MATGYVGQQALEAGLNSVYETGNVKCILMNNTHVPDEDTQQFLSDITANQLGTANGYTALSAGTGGVAVTCTVVRTEAGNLFDVTFGQAQWTASGTLSAYCAVYVDDTGVDATSKILYQNDFTNQPTSATDATFTVNSSSFQIDFPNVAD